MDVADTTLRLLRTGELKSEGVSADTDSVGTDIAPVGDDNFINGTAVQSVGDDTGNVGGDTKAVGTDRRSKHLALKAASGLVRKAVWIPAAAAPALALWVEEAKAGHLPPNGAVAPDPNREAGLELEIERLREALAAAQTAQAAMVPAGELEIALTELNIAKQAAHQATRAKEVQANINAAQISRLESTLAAYKDEVEKLSKRATFAGAVFRILERLPGHRLDPDLKILKGPNESEILRFFAVAREASPGGAKAFEAVVFAALRPQPKPKQRSWYDLIKRHHVTSGKA